MESLHVTVIPLAGDEILHEPPQAHDPRTVPSGPQEERHHVTEGLWPEPRPPGARQPGITRSRLFPNAFKYCWLVLLHMAGPPLFADAHTGEQGRRRGDAGQ